MKKLGLIIYLVGLPLLIIISSALGLKKDISSINQGKDVQITESILLDSVWVANKVSFSLHTVGNKQFVAYYDKDRMMTVAARELGNSVWQKKTLPNKLKWDSHNYVAMGIDEKGYIHISGNMHVNPLVYFRSTRPYDINSLIEINKMVGIEESDVTYPKFFYDGDDRLYFSYRSGTCGNGNVLINRFDSESETWSRYLNKPLFEGIEKNDDRAAYHSFVKDSKGDFHFIWMWRWNPDVETSHQICYATTTDLFNWKNAAGETISLPFKPDNEKVIVDPSSSKGGMHNGRYQLILSKDDKPYVGYIKYDENGLTQLYLAKFDGNEWIRNKISNWDFRWKFFGGGDKMSKGANFSLEGFSEEGFLVISWDLETGKTGRYIVDPTTLENVQKDFTFLPRYPENIKDKISDNPNLSVALQEDSGKAPVESEKYVLKWETMGKSHGRHAPDVIPSGPISSLYVLKVKTTR